MDFFPYDAGLLRCHPVRYALATDQSLPDLVRCSNKTTKYKWNCSQCGAQYNASERHVNDSIYMFWFNQQPMSSKRKVSIAF